MKTKFDTLKDLAAHIADKCTPVDREAAFDAMLDDCYSFEKVGGPFACMSPSRVLLACDPIAYRCGVNDYADGEKWTEIGSETYETSGAEIARTEFVGELETEAEALETEIEEESERADTLEESGEVADAVQLRAMMEPDKADLAALRENINAAVTVELYRL
jgi:hypothetical protein